MHIQLINEGEKSLNYFTQRCQAEGCKYVIIITKRVSEKKTCHNKNLWLWLLSPLSVFVVRCGRSLNKAMCEWESATLLQIFTIAFSSVSQLVFHSVGAVWMTQTQTLMLRSQTKLTWPWRSMRLQGPSWRSEWSWLSLRRALSHINIVSMKDRVK